MLRIVSVLALMPTKFFSVPQNNSRPRLVAMDLEGHCN